MDKLCPLLIHERGKNMSEMHVGRKYSLITIICITVALQCLNGDQGPVGLSEQERQP